MRSEFSGTGSVGTRRPQWPRGGGARRCGKHETGAVSGPRLNLIGQRQADLPAAGELDIDLGEQFGVEQFAL